MVRDTMSDTEGVSKRGWYRSIRLRGVVFLLVSVYTLSIVWRDFGLSALVTDGEWNKTIPPEASEPLMFWLGNGVFLLAGIATMAIGIIFVLYPQLGWKLKRDYGIGGKPRSERLE